MAVGIIGYNGSVGKTVTEYLLEKGFDVIGASRHEHNFSYNSSTFRSAAVDINNRKQLESFISKCELVINCAAPAYIYAPLVAEVSGNMGCTYLDLTDSIIGKALPEDNIYISSCGYVPGLSAIFPDIIIKKYFESAESVCIYQGGTGMCSDMAMLDVILTSESSGYIDSFAHKGNIEKITMDVKKTYSIEYIGKNIFLKPYLSYEMLHFAKLRNISSVRWFNAYVNMKQFAFFLRLITALSKNDREKAFQYMAKERNTRAEADKKKLHSVISGDITGIISGERKCMRFTHKVCDANAVCGIAAGYTAEKVLNNKSIKNGLYSGFEFVNEGILDELEKHSGENDFFKVEEIPLESSLENTILK